MSDKHPPTKQKIVLEAFARALGSADNAFRRDECGDWRINGSRGHVYAAPEGFQIFVRASSRQAWTWAKKALVFAVVMQDGDEEGILLLDRLPTHDESTTIRDYTGIRKRQALSAENLAAAKERGKALASVRHRETGA
jgi:hypothetical protein